MSVNSSNISRSLEEELLADLVNSTPSLYIPGVDTPIDVDSANAKLNSLHNKVKALISLIYLKESTILTTKKDDAIEGSIFYNKENNTIEYFDGQSWNSNIFGPNSVIDKGSFGITDIGSLSPDASFSIVSELYMNMEIDGNQIIMVVVDGDLLDQNKIYVDFNNKKLLRFSQPLSFYDNISYYVMGSESTYSESIPRYEIVEYIGDGSTSIYPISYNKDFITTYKSSIEVIVDGRVLRNSQFELSTDRNKVILKEAPELSKTIEIRTLYGVQTDFRGSLTYLEQALEAEIDTQKVFKYNGVADALKVYLNGSRLLLNKDFKFDYVQKSVILNDSLAADVKKGDILILEKELVPMSKEPMQGVMITETKTLNNLETTLKYTCNGISSIIVRDPHGISAPEFLMQTDYFVNNQLLTVTKNSVANWTIQVSYLTNSKVSDIDIPTINDNSIDSTKVWSSMKVNSSLNSKANVGGNPQQDFSVRALHATNNVSIGGELVVNSDTSVNSLLKTNKLEIIEGTKRKFYEDDNTNTFVMDNRIEFRQPVTIRADFHVEGTQTGTIVQVNSLDNNIMEFNANIQPTDPSVSESGLVIKRGGGVKDSKLLFKDVGSNRGKWVVIDDSSADETPISLEGHTHTILDFSADSGIPVFNSITSAPYTANEFYDDDEFINILQNATTDVETLKSMSRIIIEPSSVVSGETRLELASSLIFKLEKYECRYNGGSKDIEKKNLFSIIEDGSIISMSEGSFLLPSGNTDKRWESDTNYCGINGNTFKTSHTELLDGNNWRNINGLIRYNTEAKCVEMKIDGVWVQFHKPDRKSSNISDVEYNNNKRYVQEFAKSDFVRVDSLTQQNQISGTFGFENDENILIVEHNLDSAYVKAEIFDDKRTPFPLLYKCIDRNRIALSFPANIVSLTGSTDLNTHFNFLSDALHRNNSSEGIGHNGEIEASKSLDITKKFVVFVNSI